MQEATREVRHDSGRDISVVHVGAVDVDPMTQSSAAVVTPADVLEIDDLDHGRRRRHTLLWLGGLGILFLVTMPVAVGLGPVGIAPGTVAQIVAHHLFGWPQTVDWSGAQDSIVWLVRMPRVLLGAVVGAGLALAGVALQAMVRNVLADPYILGVTSGASTGAAATILFGIGAAAGASSLTASAFVGAMAATAALYLLARVAGQITSIRLLLAGVTIGYVLSAATSFLIFASDTPEGARAVLFWLLGSLSLARWSSVGIAVLVVGVTLAALVLWGRRFDALAIGDDTARTLGVPPTRFRIQALAMVSLCVGAVVAVSGGIGFVGLVVPHVARLCVGGAHRRVYPVAALIGAVFLVWADVFARLVFAPRELPIGIVTAVVGAPLLIILVRRFHPMSA
jgi:iron complex transport system permease protein